MSTQDQARLVRAGLLCKTPKERTEIIRPSANKVSLEDLPHAQDTIDCVKGLGETGLRELVIALGVWMIEKDIAEFQPEF
jgi:hypothetical protein